MKDILTNYSAIAEDIRYYHNQILQESKRNSRVKELYKGCQIMFSPLHFKPEYLLIGFNPGGGYYNWHGKIAEEFEPTSALEYFLNKHSLGEQTKSLFFLAGKENELEFSTAKINFYPWATNNVADFNQLMKLLPEDLSSDLFHFSRVWTIRLIEIIDPEVIICEGFKAYEEVQTLFPDKIHNYKKENLRSFQNLSGLNVIGYKRNQGSILKKETISDFLKLK